MALALYRKYRPRSFAEVIGQEHVTEPLIQALRAGRLNHAYLFSGPRGCGKTSSARILARSLNCAKGPTPDPCGDCESCRALAPDGPGSIDVIEIDAASHGGVDDARELRERAFFAPAISRYKIYIIDEAHMVSSAGFNALLKLVEEPPDYVKFVFATTEPEKVLGTIKSRTHHYPFRLIPPGALRPYLEQLCEAEGATVDPMVLPLVVRAGAGSVRDSLSVLDQLIAGAGPEGVTYARAVALLGVTDAGLIDDVCDALAASDAGVAFAAIERVVEAGHDPRRFTGDLLERLRDLILLRQVPDAAEKGLIDAPADQLERMKAQAGRIGPATLTRWAEIVHTGLVEMRGTASTRLLLELITARLLLPTVDASEIGVLSRLERLEQGIPAAAAWTAAPVERSTATERAAPAERSAPAEQRAPADRPMSAPPARVRQPVDSEPDDETPPWSETDAAAPASTVVPAAPGEIDAPAIRRTWDEIVQLTGRSNKRIAAMARDGVVRDVEGSTIVLVFKAAFHANSVGNDPGALLEAIHQVVGGTWQLRCEVGGDQRGPSAGRPPSGGGRSPAGKAEGSPPPIRSASPAPATTPTPMQRSTAFATDDWPETAPIGAAASAADTPEAVRPAKPAAPPWEAVSLAGGSTADPGAAGPGGGVTGSSQAAAAPEARSAEAAPERAAARADDDFGPLDEPPYDPEFDGHIEDTGPRGPASRGPAARGSATRSPAPSAAMTGRPVSPAPSGSAQGSAGSASSGVAGVDSAQAGRPGGKAGSAQGSAGSASSGVAGVDSAQAGRPGGKAGSVQGGPGLASVGGAGAAQVAEPRNGRAAAAQVAARAANRSGQRAVAPRAQQAPAKPAGQPAPNSGPEPGFDPGDEPTDEVLDASTARQSVEQQAIDSLRQRFGLVEKIADM